MVSSTASSRRGRRTGGKHCETFSGSNLCSGEQLLEKHAMRVAWWLTLVLVVIGIVWVLFITDKMDNDPTSPWNSLAVNTWISPTARSLGALVGLVIVLSTYSNYMLSMHKGHLDNYPAQYAISAALRVTLWVFFLHGLAYGGTIGSAFSLATLAVLTTWGVLTGHVHSPYHAWLTVTELGFIIFLLVWMTLARATMFPSP